MSENDRQAMLLSQVTKHYDGKHGIFDINLKIHYGEVFGFLGPNGAGKSTTINTILDVLRPNQGRINVLGLDHHDRAKQVHRRIGYLSGDMETDPTLTGNQYLSYVAHLHGNVDKSYVSKLINRLKADTSTKIKHLSRGSKQKIGLIAALMHKPKLLILDEPTSGLDPLIQLEFAEIIQEHKTQGKTAFISSHVLSEVQSMCDRVGFIREGKLVDVSTLSSLMEKAPRRVFLSFEGKSPLEKLRGLNGVSEFKSGQNSARFLFKGDVNQLLKLLSSHKLTNFSIAELDLEELFMSHYSRENG